MSRTREDHPRGYLADAVDVLDYSADSFVSLIDVEREFTLALTLIDLVGSVLLTKLYDDYLICLRGISSSSENMDWFRTDGFIPRLKPWAFACIFCALSKTTISVPTISGNMVKVDSKGRIVLPQEVRERLGITPGTEVEIHEEDGKAVVEPEDSPDKILKRMEQLVEETSSERGETTPLTKGSDPIAQKHRNAVRRGAEKNSDE